ncbi:MAG TPA: sialate O-acetylesterase [archaeon]|nr:sialate O-acetylesterase [archaeon]
MNAKALRFLEELLLFSLLLAFSAVPAAADVKLPRLFNDHMVLQCGMRTPVWGWADPGEKVRVEFGTRIAETTADKDGKWMLRLAPLDIGGPFELLVSGKNTILIKDVLVGEVWLCSGQSNMAMEVRSCLNAEEEIAAANFPGIRQFQVKRIKAGEPLDDVATGDREEQQWLSKWIVCNPSTVIHFTGAGYFFARELHKRLDVPIGLIHSSWGGTTAEAWTATAALEADPELKSILQNWPDYNNDEEWLKEQYSNFVAEIEQAKRQGRPAPLYFNQPAVLYNGMIAPLVPYSIRGAIWYQGESNVFRAFQYRKLFPALIRNWRGAWGQGEFPFLFVQLANFEAGTGRWPELREAQAMTLSIPNTGMASAVDIGEAQDIHPKNKQELGRRLALAARALVYKEKLVYSGPVYKSMTVEGDKCYLSFTHPGDGLTVKGGEPLKWFTIAGEDKKFVPARAWIMGDKVIVWSEAVAQPVAVRYAWADNPESANLYNKAGDQAALPASPFRTDDWPGLTADRK